MVDTCTRHDDYETFAAKYLGVDYEDFVNLQLGHSEDDDSIEYCFNYTWQICKGGYSPPYLFRQLRWIEQLPSKQSVVGSSPTRNVIHEVNVR